MPTENQTLRPFSVGQCATLACVLEVTAPKPGNVHRGADFDDCTYMDFLASAVAIGPVMDAAEETSVGEMVLSAVRATRVVTQTNTNLGTILLLAPLAKAAMQSDKNPISRPGVSAVLKSLDARDAQLVYEAIRLARPGGLGAVPQADVQSAPPVDLLAAMKLAADRDMVAHQYVTDFDYLLNAIVHRLAMELRHGHSLADAIVRTYLRVMSVWPDSLIARKAGPAIAQQSAIMAAEVLCAGPPGEPGQPGEQSYMKALSDLDFWLRSDGRRRNPGTSADLIAAALFVALWNGVVRPPFNMSTRLQE